MSNRVRVLVAGAPAAGRLRARYLDELRPMLGRPNREDLTLELWVKMIQEVGGQSAP